MSAPVFELLKRPDELFVVEHAHLRPRFVEDSVRVAVKGLLDEVPGLADDDFLLSRQVNLETIHDHDVLAERWGTVGELREEIAGHDGVPQTSLADWLSRVAALAPPEAPPPEPRARSRVESGDVCRCRKNTASARDCGEQHRRPRLAEREAERGSAAAVTSEASEA